MLAARLHAVGDLRVAPEPEQVVRQPGWSLLSVTSVGICGSDLHWFTDGGIGENRIEQPVVPGHEFAAVAVTGPYMHNGVFKDLRTVVLFYVKYKSKKPSRQINPETGQAWDAPEVPDNIAMTELTSAPALDDKRVDAIVAFLKTLTDKRYEHLLPENNAGQGATPPAQPVSLTPLKAP